MEPEQVTSIEQVFTIVKWCLGAVTPAFVAIWALMRSRQKLVDSLQELRLEDANKRVEHAEKLAEIEKRHGEERLRDLREFTAALETNAEGLSEAVRLIELHGESNKGVEEVLHQLKIIEAMLR
jgi:acyl-CoA reductase-like NAD-dependent aldehyde dehydrogenase